jgi:AraC family transcriptional regulator
MVRKLPSGTFFGQPRNRRVVAGIVVVESVHPRELAIPPHEHETAFFDFVVAGACTESLGSRSRARDRATLAFHPAGEVHASRWYGSDSRCFHVEVPAALIDRTRQYSASLSDPACFLGGKPAWLAARLYGEYQRPDDISDLAIEGLTLELLSECARHDGRPAERTPPRWLQAVRDHLHDRFSQPLSVSAVAESVGIHPAHLARVFRQFHACTVGDYVRRLRVEFASWQLRDTDTPLVRIALAAGFSDQSHFSNTFREYTGVSPAAFRRSCRPRKSDATPCSSGARNGRSVGRKLSYTRPADQPFADGQLHHPPGRSTT